MYYYCYYYYYSLESIVHASVIGGGGSLIFCYNNLHPVADVFEEVSNGVFPE
jgi:hypothetical protein